MKKAAIYFAAFLYGLYDILYKPVEQTNYVISNHDINGKCSLT